jgi:uncharacterized Zn finger protein
MELRLLEKVASGAIAIHPDWVIRVSQEQAEELINKVQSKYYTAGVCWLKKAHAAYLATGQKAEWRAYLSNLRDAIISARVLILTARHAGTICRPRNVVV